MSCMRPCCWHKIQCSIVYGVAGDILSECGQGRGQSGMIEIPRDKKEGLWVLCLH